MTKLQNYTEFKNLLDGYEVSEEATRLLESIKLVVVSSITSAGRNTLINHLVQDSSYVFVPSDTTRQPRINKGVSEQNGVEYFFKSEEEFLEGLKNQEYLEAKLIHNQQVSGTSINNIKEVLGQNKTIVIEANFEGAADINKARPETIHIFVLPPDYETWMERLNQRGFMSQDEFRNRLISAEQEVQAAIDNKFYKIVINTEVEQTLPVVKKIIETREYTDEQRRSAETTAWKLLNNIKENLHS